MGGVIETAWASALPGVSPGVYTQNDFEAISRIVHEAAGIVLPEAKATLVYSRLAPLVRATNSSTFSAYIKRIEREEEERRRAVCALTTNHTFFFREVHHFDHFRTEVRPGLLAAAEAGEEVRMWSAGSSSGEEVWSLTMTLLGEDAVKGRTIASRPIRILASDLADHALAAARAAEYPVRSVEPVPPALRRIWLKESNDRATLAPEPRSLVRFRSLNLLGPWPMQRQFDVIFCRNVMIYFDQPTKEQLIERLAAQLVPGGFLYIGHSERVTGPATSALRCVGPTIYRKQP